MSDLMTDPALVRTRTSNEITLNEYGEAAHKFAQYPTQSNEQPLPHYPVFKLAGEAGEFCEKVGKALRDGYEIDSLRMELAKELGDVLWYVQENAFNLGFTLEQIAQINITKLASRQARGMLGGSGDNR